jgi:hypothetical protein
VGFATGSLRERQYLQNIVRVPIKGFAHLKNGAPRRLSPEDAVSSRAHGKSS